MMNQRVTRLAPSPTGALHLGNARTFLANWALARRGGWRIVLRIEDLDGPRVKPWAAQQAMDDLAWLGMDWDEGPIFQSHHLPKYEVALARLLETGLVYPCICTRKDVSSSAGAPHAEDGSLVYPGTCRGRFKTVEAAHRAAGRAPAFRFRVPDEDFEFDDVLAGQVTINLPRQIGDFVIAKPDRTPAYQLAVVVDDAASGVTDVVRGEDLLDSVARQTLIYRGLGLDPQIPSYTHLPLVVGSDGKRLAKRHGDTRIASYRDAGVHADRLRALLARWLGIVCGDTISARQMVEQFDLSRVPRQPIVFGADDDRWLRS